MDLGLAGMKASVTGGTKGHRPSGRRSFRGGGGGCRDLRAQRGAR